MKLVSEGGAESLSPIDSGDEQEGDTTMHNDSEDEHDQSLNQSTNGTDKMSFTKSKDPSRPKRKKARRACFACQRAHLTCGMSREWPCHKKLATNLLRR